MWLSIFEKIHAHYGKWFGIDLDSETKDRCLFPKDLHMDFQYLAILPLYSTNVTMFTIHNMKEASNLNDPRWILTGKQDLPCS